MSQSCTVAYDILKKEKDGDLRVPLKFTPWHTIIVAWVGSQVLEYAIVYVKTPLLACPYGCIEYPEPSLDIRFYGMQNHRGECAESSNYEKQYRY
jgi:hypothetical protein